MKFGKKFLVFFALLILLASPTAVQMAYGDDDIVVPSNYFVAGDDDIVVPSGVAPADSYAAAAGDDDIVVPSSYTRITLI